MSESVLIGFISVAALVVINIVMAAFHYGRLKQQVEDACRRITRLENIANGHRSSKESDR